MTQTENAPVGRLGDHELPPDFPELPRPLGPVEPAMRRSPGEEARTLVAATNVASLATLTEDGHPWASLVTYGALLDGSPVLLVSRLAEHGRNLARDARASLVVAAEPRGRDPLAKGRVTLTGHVERPENEDVARDVHLKAVPTASAYAPFGDFSLWVLRVEQVRWVGGYGVMDWADAGSYATSEPDPVASAADYAVGHMNDDHPDALLAMAVAFSGHTDATAARCTGADRYGLDLMVSTPRGKAPARVGFAQRVDEGDGLRQATIELTRRARAEA